MAPWVALARHDGGGSESRLASMRELVPVGEHHVPVGPLAVRWFAYAVDEVRAGARSMARVLLENAGSAPWRSRVDGGVRLSYHWLDDRGNPIVWDCPRVDFAGGLQPGARAELDVPLRAPLPPGRYTLAFDLVEEHRFWFSEIGVPMLEAPVEVRPRIAARRLAVVVRPGPGDNTLTTDALMRQDEPPVVDGAEATAYLVAGSVPASDWASRLLDAHAEGYAAVGPRLEAPRGLLERRRWAWLDPWSKRGRNPRFTHPLILPSLLAGFEPSDYRGLPAYTPDVAAPWDDAEPSLYEGTALITLRLRPGRPPA